jgi:CheY-like chemotaxis protein
MLKILIVEDEPLTAATLKHLIELNPFYTVTAMASDFVGALQAVAEQVPDLALVDLKLANGTTGFTVAARLHEMEILCLLTTGNAPSFPVPDLAIGCLSKPFDEGALVHALAKAEDIVRRRDKLVRKQVLPEQLQLYARDEGAEAEIPVLEERMIELAMEDEETAGGPSLVGRIWGAMRRPPLFRSSAQPG